MLIYSNDILKISCETIFDQGDIYINYRGPVHTAWLFSPLTYDLRRLTFHQVTDIQTLDIMYIDR